MADLTTAALAVAAVYQKELEKSFYDGRPLVDLLGRPVPSDGDSSYKWLPKYAGNASADNFDEDDTPPVAGYCSYVDLELAYEHSWAFAEFTGHLLAANKGSGQRFNIIEEEMTGAKDALWYKIESNAMSSLETAVDDAATWAGKTRATYNQVPVVRTASSTALAESDLKYVHLNMRKRAAIVPNDTVIFAPPEQTDAYEDLFGVGYGNASATAVDNRPHGSSQSDASYDIGQSHKPLTYRGIRITELVGMTSTIMLWVLRSKLKFIEHEGVKVEPMGITKDTTTFKLTWRGKLIVRDVYHAGRIEGLAT